MLCYVHFEKTYTLKTHVTFFESVYCELLEKTYTLNTHVKIGIFCTCRTKFRSLAWNVSGVPGRHNFGLSRGKCPAWPRNQFCSFAYSSSFANGSSVYMCCPDELCLLLERLRRNSVLSNSSPRCFSPQLLSNSYLLNALSVYTASGFSGLFYGATGTYRWYRR